MTGINAIQQDLVEQFTVFDDWMDRYQLLISMGRKTKSFPIEKRVDQYFVPGCQSQVWFDIQEEGDKLRFSGTSDAAIVAGLVALLMKLYDNQTPADILATPPDFIAEIGFDAHLSPTRQTGLYAMLKELKLRAQAML